ncbi:MAG: DUF2256 domain-containing protein [Gemmataceae bacterium]
MKTRKKSELPEKICPVCHRAFRWRRKWSANWDQVKYCSNLCRSKKHPRQKGGGAREGLEPGSVG